MKGDPSLAEALDALRKQLEGELYTDEAWRLMYATDASAYREKPLGVARPKNVRDLHHIIHFASQTKIPLIPRTAGTSLAGQVVGNGLVVDVSKYMTRILEINEKEHWVRVEPGVILDELNKAVEPYGLFFGPETSTSSRCMMGGMIPVGGGAFGANLGAALWSQDKGAEGVKADEAGTAAMHRVVDRLIRVTALLHTPARSRRSTT